MDGITQMRKLLGSGIWEIFIPDVAEGAHYKFEVKASHGGLLVKSDPYAFYGQHSKETASMVFELNRYTWGDAEWMEKRKATEWHKTPISIYEVHPGSWARHFEDGNRYLSYIELADALINYVVDMGYTHIELMGISEHPFDGSMGIPGDRLLRADQPAMGTRMSSGTSWTAAINGGSG